MSAAPSLTRNGFRGASGAPGVPDRGMDATESFQGDIGQKKSSDCVAMTVCIANDDIAPDEIEARARNAAALAAGVAAFNARRAEDEARRARRREADAAAKRAKTGRAKRLSRVHPLKLTPREAQLLKLLLEKPRTVAEIGAALGVKKSGRIYLTRSLTQKLAAVGGVKHAVAIGDPDAVRRALAVTP